MAEAIRRFDFSVLDFIQQKMRTPFLDRIIPKITVLGDNGIFWIIAAGILIIFKSYRECGISALAGMMSGVILGNFIVKNIVRRDRPCWINQAVDMLIEIPRDYSFPSGHTMSSFITATIFFYYDKRIGIPAFVVAFAIAFSRMYLYVHFPTDVIAGALIGISIGCGTIYFLNRYLFN